ARARSRSWSGCRNRSHPPARASHRAGREAPAKSDSRLFVSFEPIHLVGVEVDPLGRDRLVEVLGRAGPDDGPNTFVGEDVRDPDRGRRLTQLLGQFNGTLEPALVLWCSPAPANRWAEAFGSAE